MWEGGRGRMRISGTLAGVVERSSCAEPRDAGQLSMKCKCAVFLVLDEDRAESSTREATVAHDVVASYWIRYIKHSFTFWGEVYIIYGSSVNNWSNLGFLAARPTSGGSVAYEV
jgi:hypothetical protein